MQAFGEAAALHHAAREFVDQDNLVVLDDIVLVLGIELVGPQRLLDMMHDRDIGHVIHVRFRLQQLVLDQDLLEMFVAVLGQHDGALLLIQLEILVDQLRDHLVDLAVEIAAVVGGAGNDQRRAGFVDQDGVHLVDDGEVVAALDHVLQRVLHIVAQIVESELVVRAIGDVRGVGGAALVIDHAVNDAADRQTQEIIDLAHPFGVARGQIVVDRDHVHAGFGNGVQIHRQRGDQRLALAGLHLGDIALVHHDAADKLHVVMALAQCPLGGLAHRGKGFRQQGVKFLAVLVTLAELGRFGFQLIVAERLEFRLQPVDLVDRPLHAFDNALIGRPEKAFGEIEHR